MRNILILASLLICSTAFAGEEIYSVERPDGGVSIIHYNTNSVDSIEDVLNSLGFMSYPIRKINSSDIPQDRTDRNYWRADRKKVVIDADKKQADSDVKSAKELQRLAVLQKLKISKDELAVLNAK